MGPSKLLKSSGCNNSLSSCKWRRQHRQRRNCKLCKHRSRMYALTAQGFDGFDCKLNWKRRGEWTVDASGAHLDADTCVPEFIPVCPRFHANVDPRDVLCANLFRWGAHVNCTDALPQSLSSAFLSFSASRWNFVMNSRACICFLMRVEFSNCVETLSRILLNNLEISKMVFITLILFLALECGNRSFFFVKGCKMQIHFSSKVAVRFNYSIC